MKPRTMAWGIIITGGIMGALLGAGTAGARPGGLPQCLAELNTCNTDLGTCNADLTQAQGNLTTCNSDLGTCTTGLGTCNTSLTQAQDNLATCNTTLGTCTTDLTQAQGNLATCNSDLGTCTTDLAACQAATCGNGIAEFGEACDGANLQGATCATATEGFTYGTLACSASCTLDTSQCTNDRFVDNGNGTITDNQTGLQWEKKSDDGGVHDRDNVYQWSASGIAPDGRAFTVFLAALNNCLSSDGATVAGGFAGHCDWRLPTIVELQTILDCSSGSPCVDPAFNTGCTANCTVTTCSCTAASVYWSSTSFAGDPGGAWDVFFNFGNVFANGKDNDFHVRAVRGGS